MLEDPDGIRATTGNPAVSVARLDLLDRGSVDQLVRDLAGPLHILVNNAGVMAVPGDRKLATSRPDVGLVFFAWVPGSCAGRPLPWKSGASGMT